MKERILLVRSNLRKSKGQNVSILVLMLLASFLLNLWLMLTLDYKENFVRCHERLNGEHVALSIDREPQRVRSCLTQMLEADGRTAEFYLDDALQMVGSFSYNQGEVNSEFIFLPRDKALSRPIGRAELVDDGDYDSGVYLPLLYRSSETQIGRTIEIVIGSQTKSYVVCGFFNSAMAGSHNCGMCEILLTEDCYRELAQSKAASEGSFLSVRLKDASESEAFRTELLEGLSQEEPEARMTSNDYQMVSQSRYISQMICSGIISAASFFLLLIALVVIASNIAGDIRENMKNLGALKAIGYTKRQLIASLQMQFLGSTLLAAVFGIIISYLLFPVLNEGMISQTGIPYEIHFLPLPFLLTLGILSAAVSLVVWFSARGIGRIEPIVALRQGMQTHSFKRNHVPLERPYLPLTFSLALKMFFSGVKQNITICITMLVLSLMAVFSGVMAFNMIADQTPFLNMIVGEIADSCINVSQQSEEAFLAQMQKEQAVEKVYLYNSVGVRHVGGAELMATIADDFSLVNHPQICVKGRIPKYENETSVGIKYAKEAGLVIGDEITLAAEGQQQKYLITGFTQNSNNLGKDCLLTREGYQRMGTLKNVSFYLNLKEGTDIDAFHQRVQEQFPGQLHATLNIHAIVEGSSSVYVSLMTMIVLAMLLLSALVMAFVLHLLVKMMLQRKKQEYGILKSLGFTTGQLILQTALCFMPAMAVSLAAGLVGWSLLINQLIALFLQEIGIVVCSFRVPVGWVALLGVLILVFAFLLVCLLSQRIRRISPRSLLVGE